MPISFGDYKTKMKQLETDNLELMKALQKTTINLQTSMFATRVFMNKLRETMSDQDIDKLLAEDSKKDGKASIILPQSIA